MISNQLNREMESPSFPGLYLAQVEQVADLEAEKSAESVELGKPSDRLKRGEIRISIPSIFGETAAKNLLRARPCFPYGHFFVPEKGDKVWVAFENGNPTAPVWLGICYPEGTVPTEAERSLPMKRVIKTSSGHLIILNDRPDSTKLEIQDFENNMNVIELANSRITLRSKGTIEIQAPNVIINKRTVAPSDRPI